MPFDGSGNYSPLPPPTFPAVSGQPISSTYYNAQINDMATAISNCLTRDGQGKPSVSISWNGKDLTNVAALSGASAAFTSTLSVAGVSSLISLAVNRAFIAGATAELQVQTDAMLGGAGVNSLHFNGYYNAGYKYTVAGRSAAIRHDAATGILQFMTSITAGVANAASDIREVGNFNPAGDFATIGALRPGSSIVMQHGTYFYTPYNGVTDTGTVRAGIALDGTGQIVNFYTANTVRGSITAGGTLAMLGGITATTLTTSGAISGSILTGSIATGSTSPVNGTSGLPGLPSGAFTNNGGGASVFGVSSSITSGGANTSSWHYSGVTQSVAIWYLYGNGTTSYTSDWRTKENIKPARSGYLDDLMSLEVIKYDRRKPEDIDLDNPGPMRLYTGESEPSEIGLLAQKVRATFPGLVEYALHNLDGTLGEGTKSLVLKAEVIYGPIMLAAFQELVNYTRGLEARLAIVEDNQ